MVSMRAICLLAAVMIFLNAVLAVALVKTHQSSEPLRIENQRLKAELDRCRNELKIQKMINDVPPRQASPESP